MVDNWKHSGPKGYYVKCLELFGIPVFVANVKNGSAYWKTKGLFDEHLLRDESVKHCVPRNHLDYFYSSVKFYIPPNKVLDVLKISGSINYDGLKKHLTDSEIILGNIHVFTTLNVDRQREAFGSLLKGLRELDDRNGFAYNDKNLVIGSINLVNGAKQVPAKLIQITKDFLIFEDL